MQRLIVVSSLILLVGFILGWIFPVEGPVDYVYDNYRAEKVASKACPPQKPPTTFTEEELDYINELLEEISEKQEGEK